VAPQQVGDIAIAWITHKGDRLLLQRSQSIGKLFLAGIVPGLMIAAFFALTIYLWCAANPALGPKGEKSSWKERLASLPELVWVLLVFVLIVGGLMKGFFTPTEAGSVGTFAVILLSVAQRGISLRGFAKAVSEALRTACMVLMLIAGSTVLGHFLAVTKIPMIASEWVVALPVNRHLIMVFIAITVMIGVVIPPVAMNAFGVIYRGVLPFLAGLVLCAALLFDFPQMATLLPSLLMK
jgi:TRAP-type C4-dicarboxylate transport system permease large subunit